MVTGQKGVIVRVNRRPNTGWRWQVPAAVCAISMLASLPCASTHAQETPRAGRIISLIPAVTEMLFSIGAGPQVVAVSSFDRYPPDVEKLERVGALLDPDLEKILSLRPDLVVVYGSQTELQAQLERAGVPTFRYRHAGLGDVTDTMRQVGIRVGRPVEAERAATAIEGRLKEIQQRVAGEKRLRTMLVFGREQGALRGIYASGGIGFLHDMLELAGGTNVFAEVQRESLQVSTELIIARRPEVILELRVKQLDAAARRAEVSVWGALASVPAVRRGRIHIIDDEKMVVPGPRIADAADLMATALHPQVR